jgi:hypothetical protein
MAISARWVSSPQPTSSAVSPSAPFKALPEETAEKALVDVGHWHLLEADHKTQSPWHDRPTFSCLSDCRPSEHCILPYSWRLTAHSFQRLWSLLMDDGLSISCRRYPTHKEISWNQPSGTAVRRLPVGPGSGAWPFHSSKRTNGEKTPQHRTLQPGIALPARQAGFRARSP